MNWSARTVRRDSDNGRGPFLVGSAGSPRLILLFLLTLPTGGYESFIPPVTSFLEHPFGAFGALAVFSRILLPLTVAMVLFTW
jgi:hypothetical protein